MNNTIILIGRITKDIEIKETNMEKVCEFIFVFISFSFCVIMNISEGM